ncbi:MAG: hypothetical protein GQ558_06465 [Thermoplasmata archaeon]|nr:hypothetical protein [Thermoplasmata archaeon]
MPYPGVRVHLPTLSGRFPSPTGRVPLLLILASVVMIALSISVTGSDDLPPERVLCDDCHEEFVPFQYTIDAPTEVPTGEPFDLSVTVFNEEMHAVYYTAVMLTVTDTEGMVIETGEPPVVSINEQGSLGFRQSATFDVAINPGAERAIFVLDGSGGFLDDLDLMVSGPDGGSWSSTGAGFAETIYLEVGDLQEGGYGDYRVTVDHPQGIRSASFTLNIGIEYGSRSMIMYGPDDIQGGESHTFTFSLRGVLEGPTGVTVTISGTAVHAHIDGEHEETDFTREEEVPFEVGDEFVYGPRIEDDDNGPGGGLLRAGQVMAFLSATLLIVSVSTSGNLARFKLPRRAKLHCWTSYLLVGTFTIHWVLLYAGPYSPPAALVTGLFMLLCIVGLAVTGVRPALLDGKLKGLSNRKLHIYITYATVVVLAVHIVLNGSHFAFLR